MKIILTGSTGHVGGEVLRQALAHPSITEAVVLARRPISDASVSAHPKLRTVIQTDFGAYDDSVIAQLQGAEACIWALGDVRNLDEAYQLKTRRDWPFAAAEAFATRVAPKGSPFRFVLTSGYLTVHNQDANLWFLSRMRKMGGQVELDFVDLPKRIPGLECFVTRPAAVQNVQRTLMQRVVGLVSQSVGVDELAAVMVDTAVNGGKQSFFENKELVEMGRALLEKTKGKSKK